MPKSVTLDPKQFNYVLFRDDLNKYRKKKGYSLEYISRTILLRSSCYLSYALNKNAIPVQLLRPLCDFMETTAAKYKIEEPKPKPEPKKEPESVPEPMPAIVSTHDEVEQFYLKHPEMQPALSNEPGWECRIRVDEDFETVMMKILKNGEEMAIARCYFFSKDNTGIMQAISYAAHQCYKSYQQIALAQQEANTKLRQEVKTITESTSDPNDIRSFKNWVIYKYKNDTSSVGRLARYCESMYDRLPSHGERKIRMFLQLEKGGNAHVAAFNAIWPLYIKEYNAAENAGNMRIADSY